MHHSPVQTTEFAHRDRSTRRGIARYAPRLHFIAFAGGAATLMLGAVAWWARGGPGSLEELVIVLDLTVGGTVLATGSLVGRARASDTRRAAYLSALQAAANRMSGTLTVEAIGRVVVEETRGIIDYHNARVYLLEPADELVPVAFEGRVGAYETVSLGVLRTRVGEGFTGWVAKHRLAIRVDDARLDRRGSQIPGTPEVDESMLVVPMQHDGSLVGVVTLSKLGVRQFDDEDLRLLQILADHAATAFSGARLLTRTQQMADELRQLLDMSSSLSRSLDPRAVANLIAEHLAAAVGANEALISDRDDVADRLRTLGCWPDVEREQVSSFYPLAEFPLTRRVLDEQRVTSVDAEDPAADAAEVEQLRSQGRRGLLMLPLVVKGEAIGLVELLFEGAPSADPGRLQLARTMAHEAAMALENARLYETARDLADRDPLTGFFNHRYLQQRLQEEVLRATRGQHPLALLMLDLDDFKLVNDTFGHLYGDGVLRHLATTLRAVLRESDVPARYGGDEFAVILPETDGPASERVAGRIREALRTNPYRADGAGLPIPVSVSIGAAVHPADGRTATELIEAADAALYRAKGRQPDRRPGRPKRAPSGRRARQRDPEPTATAPPAA